MSKSDEQGSGSSGRGCERADRVRYPSRQTGEPAPIEDDQADAASGGGASGGDATGPADLGASRPGPGSDERAAPVPEIGSARFRPTGRRATGRGGQGGRTSDPSFPEDLVQVSAWPDPVLDRLGHDPRSGYVERYWLSILGPSCLLLLRRMAGELEQHPDGFELNTVQWASELGIGMKGGKNGPFWRSIERASRFGATQRNGSRLAVRRRLPPLTARQVERLPVSLQEPHHRWAEARLQRSRRPSVVKWSPFLDDGDDPASFADPLDDAA